MKWKGQRAIIVTSCDRKYLPGLIALNNSIKTNSPDCDFVAILDGDAELESEVQALGIKTILNPEMEVGFYPVSEKWPDELPAMYWRMLIPSLFPEHERSIYIDADAIVLKDMRPLLDIDLEGKCIGATTDKAMKASTIGLPSELAEKISFITSMMVFDHAVWRDRDILARCMEVMRRDDLTFKCAVQGVMQVALMDDWYEFPSKYQSHARHKSLTDLAYILHFMVENPWEQTVPYQSKWQQYA